MNNDQRGGLPVETSAVRRLDVVIVSGGSGGVGTAAQWHGIFNSLLRYFRFWIFSGWKYFQCATVPVCQDWKHGLGACRRLPLATERERCRRLFQRAVDRNRKASTELHATIRLALGERMPVKAVVLVSGDKSRE